MYNWPTVKLQTTFKLKEQSSLQFGDPRWQQEVTVYIFKSSEDLFTQKTCNVKYKHDTFLGCINCF